MFNKIERTNKKKKQKKPLTIYQSIRIYIYNIWVYTYNTVHITSLLMPRHDDVYLLYLCTHSQTAGTKSNQMKKKNVRTEQKARKKSTSKKNKTYSPCVFSTLCFAYGGLIQYTYRWMDGSNEIQKKNTYTISFCAVFFSFGLFFPFSLSIYFLNILFQPHSF